MKEKIYTIPVTDAYMENTACPLCFLRQNIEKSTLDYYLGPSLMEPDVRVETNKTGFCGAHLDKMYATEINRLGLALMLHTHLQDISKDSEPDLRNLPPEPGSVFRGRDKDYKKKLELLADRLDRRAESCIICDKIAFTMDRYLEVLLWMFFEQEGFRELFEKKKGCCLPHFADILRAAGKHLNQNQAAIFLRVLMDLQIEGTQELIKDVEWFTLKFDYRNKDKPWGQSKDSIPRAISYLGGKDCEQS